MHHDGKLMDMLAGYAAAHSHPFNVFVHMLGIPAIMLGALVPLSWIAFDLFGTIVTLAHVAMFGFFAFYMTLDKLFALVFLVFALLIAQVALVVSGLSTSTALIISATAFFGGYAAQFIGHAVEKSMPVLVKHPVQANLAAPFFVVVEAFQLLRLRAGLFDEVQRAVARRRVEERRR